MNSLRGLFSVRVFNFLYENVAGSMSYLFNILQTDEKMANNMVE